jgi:hypothetical protein
VTAADLLRRAATLLEDTAAAATPGPWELELQYLRPEKAQGLFVGCPPDGCAAAGDCYDGTHGVGGFDTDPDNRWAALVHPGIAPALAAWLRGHADYIAAVQGSAIPSALSLARILLGEHMEGQP